MPTRLTHDPRGPAPKRHKYGAKPVVIDGVRFASHAEGRRYVALKMLERVGQITNLELQPAFPIIVNGIKVAVWKGDFAFFDGNRRRVIDVKGFSTPLFKLKRRLVEALYSIQIEVEHAK